MVPKYGVFARFPGRKQSQDRRSYLIAVCNSLLTRTLGGSNMPTMRALLEAIVGAFFGAFRPRANLVAENLVLRQQLAILRRTIRRPRLRPIVRAFWVVVSCLWSRWSDALAIVEPATVIAWHRRGFARFWAWTSRRVGRPPLAPELVSLIERMARENPLWSRRRIASELAKLGHCVDKDTVAKYMPRPTPRPRRPPSQTWKTFVRNHLSSTIAVDFLAVPTVTFNVLYVFFVLSLERRRVLHVNVTGHPYAAWAAQQIVEAVGAENVPERLIRDRDAIFGIAFNTRVTNLSIEQLKITPRSPWQNGYAERWVGTLRRELLDHVIVFGERHLLRLLRQHVTYYNEDRPHMSLGGDSPVSRAVEPSSAGEASHFRESADCTTAIRGPPDCRTSIWPPQLPARRYELAEWRPAKVNIDCCITFDHRLYCLRTPSSAKRCTCAQQLLSWRSYIEATRGIAPPRLRSKGASVLARVHRPRAHRNYGRWPSERIVA
ncbi:MAG TPA: integrase core domain-containing protein [Polyangiaceae bacterium]|nr:integrase core domain-containing protein [Polyangiaceae bacterium]